MSDDRELVIRAQNGDADAFERLLGIHGPTVGAVARMIMGGAAASEDPLQDAFIRAWRFLPKLKDPDRFGHWLRRLVVNSCLDERRSVWRSGHLAVALGRAAEPQRSPEPDIVRSNWIHRALQMLTPEHRTVLVLRYGNGLSGEEIAETLGIPAGTVRSRIHNAITAMRAALADPERVGIDTERESR